MLATILGIVLIILAVVLVALVLMLQGKHKKLSGAIAGGYDTFFGKSKSGDTSKVLSLATAITSVVFVGLVVALYLIIG
jgi:preprotein translocase subunit SecG